METETKINENAPEELYTIMEVAKLLKVTTTTIHNWIEAGKIPYKVLTKGKRKRMIRFVPSKIKKHFNL